MAWKSVKNLFSLDTTSNNASHNKKNANASSRIVPRPTLSTVTDSTSKPPSSSSSRTHFANDIHQQLRNASELLYLHLPEDVKSVLDKLRTLQNAEKSLIFDQKMENGEWQSSPKDEDGDHLGKCFDAQHNLSSRPSSSIIQGEHNEENMSNMVSSPTTLSVILETVENPHDQQRRNSHYSTRSRISTSTFHSDLSTSSSKNSSLLKVLSASTLLTTVIGSIMSMHNDALMNSFTESSTLDSYHSLHEKISNEADAMLRYVRKITTQGKTEELSVYGQAIYDKLVVHSGRLVDSLDSLVNFVNAHLPVLREERESFFNCFLIFDIASSNISKIVKLKKSTSAVTSMKSQENVLLTAEEQAYQNSKSKKSKNSPPDDSDYSGRSSLTSERGRSLFSYHQTSAEVSRHNRQMRNKSRDSSSVGSLASNTSAATAPMMYTRTRKIAFSEGSSSHTSLNSNVFYTDISSPSTPSSFCSLNYRVHGGHLPPNHEPLSPTLSSPSKNSKFREQIDDSPSRMLIDLIHPLSLYSHKISKSSTSLEARPAKSRESEEKDDENNSPSTSRSRKNSHSKIKSYFLKHISSLSPVTSKGKKTSYWPVTEDLMTLESNGTGSRATDSDKYAQALLRATSLSGRQPKFHKNNSDTDLKSLQMMWAERDRLNSDEKLCEDTGEMVASSAAEVSDANNLREQLFRKIVTKKSSTNLSVKKKSSLGSMIKISNVFTRLHEQGHSSSVSLDISSHTNNATCTQEGTLTDNVDGRVLTVIDRWITLQPQNFQIEPELRNQLQEFLTDGVSNAGFQTDAERMQKILSDIPSLPSPSPSEHLVQPKVSNENFQKSLSPKKPPTLYDSSPLLEFNAKDIAMYLTLMDFDALKSITFFDFITVWWRKRQAFETGGSPNAALQDRQFGLEENRLDAFTRRSNMLGHWIEHEICSLRTVKARRTILQKFIDTAKYCLEWNNFHTAMFIALALNSRPVRRLEKTWETLSHQAFLNLQSIEELIDSSGNMRRYRNALAQATPPIVPFFGKMNIDFIQRNNTFLPAGHQREKQFRIPSTPTAPVPEYNPESRELPMPASDPHSNISNASPEEHQQPLINFEKFLLLKKNVYNITRFTSKSYPFENQLSSHSLNQQHISQALNSPNLNDSLSSPPQMNIDNNIIHNNSDSNTGDLTAPLDYIGKVIENRLFEAAGAMFGGNVASIAMSDGGELEAELMALSLEAEPIAQQS
ncbi:12485_t:CDS:10 [Acaulospora colombiana]|uniref:12485_t:CDS:1 n=1 Tax=Acaulospora colombiana TaxID=27376 RepID=A0ACA9LWK1_9GLOM|nr:12485_t:CDS:10 [Acaulospora colombiana]